MSRDAPPMSSRRSAFVLVLLLLLVWLPALPVAAGLYLPLPDDVFVSDLADGEWPLRVRAGELLWTQGLAPWTPDVSLGLALGVEPWIVPIYALLPDVTALGVHLGILLSVAAGGSFALARRHGASVPAAALAGVTFAWSGYCASQARHPVLLGVAVWLPLGLALLEGAAGVGADGVARPVPAGRRARLALLYGLVFGIQAAGGFPQVAYYSALVYAAVTIARMVQLRRASTREALAHGAAVLAATAIGAAMGIASLLPMAAGGGVSDRAGGVSWEFASTFGFWPPDLLALVLPYPFGDVGDGTYFGGAIFWEDQGYVGLLAGTLALSYVVAHLAAGRGAGRPHAPLWIFAFGLALVVALGPATPVFRLLFELLPGMDRFRFPMRLLFVMVLALTQLAAHGLDEIARRRPALRRWTWPIVAACALDVAWFNARQNPYAPVDRIRANPTADLLRDRPPGRIYPRGVMARHVEAYEAAHGWADLEPLLALRPRLQPNSNLIQGLATITGYVPITASGVVDLTGDHNRDGLLQRLDDDAVAAGMILDLLGASYVTTDPGWAVAGTVRSTRVGDVALLEREGASRVRVVRQAVAIDDPEALERALRARTLDLRTTAVLRSDQVLPPLTPGRSTASVVSDAGDALTVDVDGDGPGLLVVADAAFPGWVASLDGAEVPIVPVDRGLRGIAVPGGPHRVVMRWEPVVARRAIAASGVALAVWAVAFALACLPWRRIRPVATPADVL